MPASIDLKHPDLFAVWTERSGLLTRSANWPAGLDVSPEGRGSWHFKWAHTHYRALRVFHVPVLDREEGKAFRPQSLTIVYAAPMHYVDDEVKEAGFNIAVSSLLLLGATVLLALWGIRRGLLPLQALAEQAAQISTHNWELHAPEGAQQIKEIRQLTQSMTSMLARIQHSFDNQKKAIAAMDDAVSTCGTVGARCLAPRFAGD
jgi:hypothetical protein